MPISSEGNKPVSSIRGSICGEPDRVIRRPEKGLVMKFLPDRVIKDYSISRNIPTFHAKSRLAVSLLKFLRTAVSRN